MLRVTARMMHIFVKNKIPENLEFNKYLWF